MDLFDLFRYALGTVVTIYATVVSLQVAWEWYVWLTGPERYVGMVRRYVIVQALRLRFATFWGDVLVCGLLCLTFLLMWRVHVLIQRHAL